MTRSAITTAMTDAIDTGSAKDAENGTLLLTLLPPLSIKQNSFLSQGDLIPQKTWKQKATHGNSSTDTFCQFQVVFPHMLPVALDTKSVRRHNSKISV